MGITTKTAWFETVAEAHNVSLSAQDAPSLQASKRIGKVFQEFDSDSSAMIVLEGDQPLGADAHHYYDGLIQKLRQDTRHVEHIDDFWGDPLTAAGSQSADGKAALVQVYLAGNQGESLANESVDAIRRIVGDTPPPSGVKAYVTGAAPLVTDQFEVGRHGTLKTTLLTLGVIAVMLFSLYRRLTTVFLVLFTVMIELTASRGVVAVLANAGIIKLSTYSTNLLTLLVIAAGTDYAIFLLGRFHEARYDGQDRVTAFNTMYRGTAHIILGSGLTIAGAVLCLSFTRLPYFQTLGLPAGLGVLIEVLAALTLTPAVLVLGCTHYPLIRRAVAEVMGEDVALVDSAEATVREAEQLLGRRAALSKRRAGGRLRCYVSDNPQRFREVGSRFLGEPIKDVAWTTPEQFFVHEPEHEPTPEHVA